MKTLGVLGLILCWTLLCNGDSIYNAANGEPPDANENLVDLLRREELMLNKNTDFSYFQTGSRNFKGDETEIHNAEERETCLENSDCQHGGTCPSGETEGDKFCACKDGFSGDKCEIIDECLTKKFEACVGDKGSCEYDETGKKAICKCTGTKKLNPVKAYCEETCSESSDCQHGGTCENPSGKTEGDKFCTCKKELSGDKCENIDDCITGKYKACKGDKGSCEYDETNEKAICKCTGTMKLNPLQAFCEECKCPGKNVICHFGDDGEKQCTCEQGYEKNGEKCTETCSENSDCKHGGSCEHPSGKTAGDKFCTCKNGISGDKCEIIDECLTEKFEACVDDKGSCEYDETGEKAFCKCTGTKKLNPVKAYCEECKCPGKNVICQFGDDGEKECACEEGYEKKGEECTECNCGENSISCMFQNDGTKKCNCQTSYNQNKLGICAESCETDIDCKYNGTCSNEDGIENGVKFCKCKPGLSGAKCEKIDACSVDGEYASCKDDVGNCIYVAEFEKAVCECQDEKSQWNPAEKTCAETCVDEDQCAYGSTCEGEEEGAMFCSCNEGLSGANCTIIDACETGDYKQCRGDKGSCDYDEENYKAVCNCPDKNQFNPKNGICEECFCGKEMKSCEFTKEGIKQCTCASGYALKNGICTETCTDGDCEYEGTCEGKDGAKFCKCKTGLSGSKCNIIEACETGIYKHCKEDKGECEYLTANETAICTCLDGMMLNPDNICSAQCSKKEDCNGGECKDNFCICPEGFSGDFCEVNEACVAANCEAADATCEYNSVTKVAKCKCKDPLFVYNEQKKDCNTPVWCDDNPCPGAKCSFQKGVGICKCEEDEYYNYHENRCEKINPCIIYGVVCGENKKCDAETGQCKCLDGYQASGEVCQPNFCSPDPCFEGAVCSETKIRGVVKCTCDEKSFYRNGNCYDGSCFLDGYRINCTQSCPTEMEMKDGDCVPKEGKECGESKDCGYGWCVKRNNKDTCVCKDKVNTVKDKVLDKCVLKKSLVCPSTSGDDPMICNCTGMHKYADNEITCEKRGCADEDVVEECNGQRGICKDYWKRPTEQYKCTCSAGQQKDTGDVCKDMCSIESVKESCYVNSQSCFVAENGALDCRCPPALREKTLSEKEIICDFDSGKHAYMLHKLPVESQKYTSGDVIDSVSLSNDIIDAMKAMFFKTELEFVRLYNYRKDKDVFLCDVWLQFADGKMTMANRWSLEKLTRNVTTFLPPALVLSAERLDKVKPEELDFCSGTISKTFCGEGSTCKNNKCSCKPGYRVLDSTIRKSGDILVLQCEDIDECTDETHECPDNTQCINTRGDYYCKCAEGYKKSEGPADEENKKPCTDLCNPNPCTYGSCKKVNNTVDCECKAGYTGSLCQRQDLNFAKASKNTVIVGAILGTLLGVLLILFLLYIRRQRKSSYSEDFTPAPRIDNAEMVERRPMRGVTNKAYM